MDEFEWVRSFATSSYGSMTDAPISLPESPQPANARSRGSFASFVCHVVSLERKLRSFSPIVLDTGSVVKESGKNLGEGTTFMVRHAQWAKDPNEPPLDVALKEIITDVRSSGETASDSNRSHGDWKEILFELRALLHEPIRYHPNLVRLLGIQWGLSAMSESVYPVLLMEYASLGTLDALQASAEPLPFSMKQKLCYDVGRALTALHACGIVHGDVKHENVLIFPSKRPLKGFEYTAKLADFGGTVMDMQPSESRKMLTWTWPFQAPEVTCRTPMTKEGMMLTDSYSFGLLLWRAFTDGHGFVSICGAAQSASDVDKEHLNRQKASEELTKSALSDIRRYAGERCYPQECIELFAYALLHTVRPTPRDRDLTKAQAALRGVKLAHLPRYFEVVNEMNNERAAAEARQAPGRHGITRDALQFMLGRWGDDVDLQDNVPGNRSELDPPNPEDFLFDPEEMIKVLTWEQQCQMLEELKEAASSTERPDNGIPELKRTVAAFYVFQCYLLEFGTTFDATEAVQWLQKASDDANSHEDSDYLAQAWLWRVASALNVHLSVDTDQLQGLLQLSTIRGHRTCLQDLLDLAERSSDAGMNDRWLNTHRQSRSILLSQMGAVGMGYFFSSFMTPPWDVGDLRNVTELDRMVKTALGAAYGSCLKTQGTPVDSGGQAGHARENNAFDRIYVNRRGHGPLHYAAASGMVSALQHLITTYECNIDIDNQHVDETPLLCAAAGGKLDCALLLLENGADPNGYRHGQEGPLHWLSSFLPTEMGTIASRLVDAGADIELRSGGMRHDVRDIRADWEHLFEIQTTPLGRAVLMNNLDAVKVLLKLGANPLTKNANKHPGEWEGTKDMSKLVAVSSPFELAAVLTLPDILAAFVSHIDLPTGTPKLELIDEVAMLDLAHNRKVTPFDPLSMQSRLVRCGFSHKRNMQATLALLYARGISFHGTSSEEVQKERSRVLCTEVARCDLDMVDCLLALGYNANGTQHFRPLEKAVKSNHVGIFQLLRRYKADATLTKMTHTGAISLLHVCASRPRQYRPGRFIADALIAAGVPLESVDVRSRPPLATAVLHHNFDVASALLEGGANIHATYPFQVQGINGSETKTVSVLVEILSQHTMRSLDSLKFLFEQHKNGRATRPAFLVDINARFSVLHFLAGSPQYTHIAQITPRILNLCLETYSEPELINYRHPIVGTPLYYAATNGHKAMVERLLERGADTTFHAGPDMKDSVQKLIRPRESWTPLWTAILRLDEELRKGISFPPPGAPGNWLSSNLIQNLTKTVELLLEQDEDAAAREAFEQLQRQESTLSDEARKCKLQMANKRTGTKAGEDERPVDLSILGDTDSNDEKRIREACVGPGREWRTEELGQFLDALEL